jgi:hypothetical protein
MPYGFRMRHDNNIVWPVFEDDDIWRTLKQTVDGRDWAVGEARGNAINVAAVGPVRVRIASGQSSIDPMVPLKMRYAVSETIRQFIEFLEPGVHQFIPVQITLSNGDAPHEPHYLVNICNRVAAVDGERTRMSRASYGTAFLASGARDIIVLHEDRVAGMALWIDPGIVGWDFMNNALHDKLQSLGCTRLDFSQATLWNASS